jgi:hypothetical protein
MSSLPDTPVVKEPLAEPEKKMSPAMAVIGAIVILLIGGAIGYMLVQ